MKYLLVLLLIISCRPKINSLKLLDAYIYNNWVDAVRVEAKSPESFTATKSIINPQMTWKNILKVTTRTFSDCLFYRIPHKRLSKGKGIIKIFRVKKDESCKRTLEKKPMLVVEGVSHFKTYFTSKEEKNLITKNEFKAFHLYMSATRDEELEWALMLPLTNVLESNFINPNKLRRKKQVFKKYDEPWRSSLRPGLSLYSGDYLPKRTTLIDGALNLDYAQNNIKFCYRLDKTCKVVQDFECQKCKKGWYSVVDFNCSGGGSKLCGPSKCGQKNQPACPRGNSLEESIEKSFCFRGSKAGICEKGLETYCDENQVLVCR